MENQEEPTQPQTDLPLPEKEIPAKTGDLASQGQALQNQSKKSLPKWPLIIAGVILIATLLTGVYLLGKNQAANQKSASKTVQTATPTVSLTPTPTPDPTANWKTYSNADFSFKYPPQFTITAQTDTAYKGFHNENIVPYYFRFSTGTMIDNGSGDKLPDFSGFSISVGTSNGMTIIQYYAGQKGKLGTEITVTPVTPFGNAVEAGKPSDVDTLVIERLESKMYYISSFQNALVLPDGSDDIWRTYKEQVFSTLKFTQ